MLINTFRALINKYKNKTINTQIQQITKVFFFFLEHVTKDGYT